MLSVYTIYYIVIYSSSQGYILTEVSPASWDAAQQYLMIHFKAHFLESKVFSTVLNTSVSASHVG